jgi:hypothetical protein
MGPAVCIVEVVSFRPIGGCELTALEMLLASACWNGIKV